VRFATGESSWLFPWGLIGVDISVAALIAVIVLLPRCPAARLVSVRPLRAIGKISYGLYLWHFPCFLWLDESSTGLTGFRLLVLRVAVTFGVAAISFVAIEQPIRRRRVPRWLWRPLIPAAPAAAVIALLSAAAVGAQLPGSELAPVPRDAAVRSFGRPCQMNLIGNSLYRTAPLPRRQLEPYVFHWILAHAVQWDGGGYPNSRSVIPTPR
jgi:hypothetical protein